MNKKSVNLVTLLSTKGPCPVTSADYHVSLMILLGRILLGRILLGRILLGRKLLWMRPLGMILLGRILLGMRLLGMLLYLCVMILLCGRNYK